ncbi:nectin-2 isoform X1 [Neophocaena asiaeorientalis asiaeorientalis]|uniref:Nectin-2 isoform X1 n=1 Tax=Neophocaena asiaeorientalis asiaeorientalis TaxID=1706337 RepID=A0A341DCR2_NEOAA|nr:nectin-2 isoform X1 [Neophocaena asiaeorientalis asiaeorientalis]XP_032469240.1 LOW QUALITY PROTEIN: nectin-2 [Phocoena sinus]
MARDAALPPSKLSPLKLPLLPLLLLLLRETGAQDVRVRAAAEVRGHLGDTVELPCHLLPPAPEIRVSQVTWLRLDAPEGNQNVAIFHPQYGPSFPSPKPGKERLSFVNAGQSTGAGQGTELEVRDATLALRGLTVEDEGNYTCEFATFPRGTSRGVTWLRVIAQPQNHAETQEVTLSLDPVPVARCVSTGGRPPARVSWLSPLDGEARESQVSGPLPGTVTVTSRFTLIPLGQADGVKVTCKVEHESFEEPVLLPVTLSVRYPPEVSISGYDDNWYVGRSEASLNCDVRSKPEPTGYDWSTTSGVFPASAVAQGPKLIVHSVDRLFNTTFICTVTNAVGTGHAEQVVLVRETPNTAGAGATGGIIGGIIAAIIATAVAATGVLICRQQRKEQRLQGAEEVEDLEGPPSYKPPTPKAKLEEPEMPSQLFTLGASEHNPLKTPYFDASVSCAEQEMPRYHELPTLEERSGPLLLGATNLGSPMLVPPGLPALERVSLDLEDEEEEEDYLDKINPIYDSLSYSSPSESYQGKGFVMSRAMYV